MSEQDQDQAGLSRRSLIKRGAIVGGAAVWAAPVVQSFTSPAGAQAAGSPQCSACAILLYNEADPSLGGVKIQFTQASVDCLCACQQGTALPGGCACSPQPQLVIQSITPCGPSTGTPCACP